MFKRPPASGTLSLVSNMHNAFTARSAMIEESEAPPDRNRIGLMKLTSDTCRWPTGYPGNEAFWFCGQPAEPCSPYCDAHSARAFQPGTERQRRLYLKKIGPRIQQVKRTAIRGK